MAQYRKKPVVIDAFKWTAGPDQTDDPLWIKEAIVRGDVTFTGDSLSNVTMQIKTLEGVMTANVGDYVIRGVKGEIYPCKPDIFEATYTAEDQAKHEGLPVAGYQSQNSVSIELVNQNKRLEEQVLRVLDNLANMKGPAASNDKPSVIAVDQRWLAIGRTDFEKGFMAINRAIFKPARVKLPGDRQPM
ncbi:hypothetical protein [Bradyrhizobium sp. 33ap4]|uniref:Acb2/Tad1 domain-containing protein n=1 Tax=Bradyrhizobium sp. 33ap4 TaxID=3061630 RepID=UPI00292E5DE6|nr:hypothetical protein [Bradyrhizobium sp. 33ap4]